MGAQVILRHETAHGTLMCEAFENMPINFPVLVEIRHAGSRICATQAREVADALRNELIFAGATQMPARCGAGPTPSSCYASFESHVQKLLILLSDGASSITQSPTLDTWLAGDDSFTILPVLPFSARLQTAAMFPSSISHINAEFWHTTPDNIVPAIFSSSGMTLEQSKIFISYRQIDSAGLAMQLFDALSHKGFDVFLDHFRVPPGVNFQARLLQELGDKSMVLLIETEHLLDSEWVIYEINTAKTCGLGVLSINIDSAPEVPGVDSAYRENVTSTAFDSGKFDKAAILHTAELERIVLRIKTEHDRNLLRRRQILERSLEGAVLQAGGLAPIRQAQGCFEVTSATQPPRTYLVWLTPRPPELPDFHHVHGATVIPNRGVILGLSRLMEPKGQQRFNWLAGLANVNFDDEGQLLSVARQMVAGSLK